MTTTGISERPIHTIHKLMDETVEISFKDEEKDRIFPIVEKLLLESKEITKTDTWESIFKDRLINYSPLLTADYLDRLNGILESFIYSGQKTKSQITTALELQSFIKSNKDEFSENPFESLPTELLFFIFEKLNPEGEDQCTDELQTMLACKRFCGVIGKLQRVRLLKKGIEKALGNLLENVRPDTRILKHIAKNIYMIAEEDTRLAVKELTPVLFSASKKPYSMQNQIIATLIEAWVERNGDVSNGDKTLLPLLKGLYQHRLCNNANKIHIAELANKEGILASYKKEIDSWNPPLKKDSPAGILLGDQSSFHRKAVDSSIIPSLVISGDNEFDIGEIVAVNHQGSLIGKRKKLWYGVVREVETVSDQKQYRVYTQLFKKIDSETWIYDVMATPGELGKIIPTQSNFSILDNSYTLKCRTPESSTTDSTEHRE